MKRLKLVPYYRRVWKWLPVLSEVSHQMRIEHGGLISFEFRNRQVVLESETGPPARIAVLDPEGYEVDAISDYKGRIVGDGFECRVKRWLSMNSPSLTVRLGKEGEQGREATIERFNFQSDVTLFGDIRFSYERTHTDQSLHVAHKEEEGYEQVALVVGAVMLGAIAANSNMG